MAEQFVRGGDLAFRRQICDFNSKHRLSSYNSPNLGTAPRPRGKIEGEFLLRYKTRETIADAVHLIIPWGSVVAIFGFMYLMTVQLAGRTTLAQIGLNIMGELKLPQLLAYGFGVGGVGYGISERRLRRKKTQEMAEHNAGLEMIIDRKRTSSGLTPKGTTKPEDRI